MKNIKIILLTSLSIFLGLIYVYTKPYEKDVQKVFLNISYDNNSFIDKTIKSIEDIKFNFKEDIKENTNEQKSLININTADKETLKTLPNIGDSIADNIIYYRENVSKFSDVSDIKKVKRIGEKTFEKIKHLITIN